MIVSGFIDLLLETPQGFVVIDHKSFPGSADASRSKAIKFTGQLSVYAEAVGKATGKEVKELYIHLPVRRNGTSDKKAVSKSTGGTP